MIDWRPIADATDELKDGRDLLFAVPNDGQGGEAGHRLCVGRWHFLYKCWATSEDEGVEPAYLDGDNAPSHFVELNYPR